MVTRVWGGEICHDSTDRKQSGIRVGAVEKERNRREAPPRVISGLDWGRVRAGG
jgi:hypothetical protein